MEIVKFIDDYYYKKENLPDDFYEKIVELENLHYRNKFFKGFTDVNIIEELASTYKMGVEHFCQIDKEKENYFYEKMQNLLSNDKIIKLMDNSNDINSKRNVETPTIFKVNNEKENYVIAENFENFATRDKRSISNRNINFINKNYSDSHFILSVNENARNNYNSRRIVQNTILSTYNNDDLDNKKRKRFSMKFKLIMNKLKFDSQTLNTDELQKENKLNFDNSINLFNKDIEEQEKNFKLKLEKAKREKKILFLNNNSSLRNSFDKRNLKDLDNSNERGRKNSFIKSNSINSFKSIKNDLYDIKEREKNELQMINSNLNLSFLSRRKLSINHLIDNFFKEFLHVYLENISNSVIKNILRNFEDIYNEKKKYFIKYEEELTIFDEMTEENGQIKLNATDIDESIKLLMKSLIIERNEKIKLQDKLLKKLINEIKLKGESLDLITDEDISNMISSIAYKIMGIVI